MKIKKKKRGKENKKMSEPPIPEDVRNDLSDLLRHAGETIFSTAQFKDLTQRILPEQYLPSTGSRGLQPVVIVVSHIPVKDQKPHEPTILLHTYPVEDRNKWEIFENRTKMMQQLGRHQAVAQRQPVAVFVATEVWFRMFTEEEAKEKFAQDRDVASYADKIEAVAVMGMTIDGRFDMHVREITRDESGAISAFVVKTIPGNPTNFNLPLLRPFFYGFITQKLEFERLDKSPSPFHSSRK